MTAPPEGGRANAAAAALLGDLFGATASLVCGATSRRKRFLLAGIDLETARTLVS